jgi:hypothetical protein
MSTSTPTPTAIPVPNTKLFVLRIKELDTVIEENSHFLWSELDRGWSIDSYEVILADPIGKFCHVLIRLIDPTGTVPATPPATLPPPPAPPKTKLLVLYPDITNTQEMEKDASELWAEIDRGWAIECYEVILSAPGAGIYYVLVKMTNVKNVSALPPGATV